MWDWAEERQLYPKDLKNKLFLSKNCAGQLSWHLAARKAAIGH
jgi:hypothetical protein